MKPQNLNAAFAALAVSWVSTLVASSAQAHVTLEQAVATAGQAYKAVLRVGHGCEGTATHTVVVQLPPGFRGAKPMPKPGWTLAIERARLAEPYVSHGRTVTEDVVQVTWRAASAEAALPDAHYDEFVLRGTAPAQPGPAWFRVQQLCEKGSWNWTEIPPSGMQTRGLRAPAAGLDVRPAEPAPHHHH